MGMNCSECGGKMEAIGAGKYHCVFCGSIADEREKVSKRTVVQQGCETRPAKNEGVAVFEKNMNGVLEITCRYENCGSAGSGLLIDESGYAITNAHVVTDDGEVCSDITVKIAGQMVRASVLALGDTKSGRGPGVDLALLRLSSVPANATVLQFEDFNNVHIGEQVFVIGNSLGDGTCITSGIVSDKCRVLSGHKLLMTDCAINGGNSGGPIFNSNGLVIGVIVSSRIHPDGSATEGMNYAIPGNIVQEFIAGDHVAAKLRSSFPPLPPKRPTPPLENTNDKCPKCGSTDTSRQGEIYHCMTCDHEWVKKRFPS